MVGMGSWQWRVAMTPLVPGAGISLRNLVYALQWWIFASFAVWFWYRFMRDQRDEDRQSAELAARVEDEAGVAAVEGEHNVVRITDTADKSKVRAQISLDGTVAERTERAQNDASAANEPSER
jgi:Na+/phosphate symporter